MITTVGLRALHSNSASFGRLLEPVAHRCRVVEDERTKSEASLNIGSTTSGICIRPIGSRPKKCSKIHFATPFQASMKVASTKDHFQGTGMNRIITSGTIIAAAAHHTTHDPMTLRMKAKTKLLFPRRKAALARCWTGYERLLMFYAWVAEKGGLVAPHWCWKGRTCRLAWLVLAKPRY